MLSKIKENVKGSIEEGTEMLELSDYFKTQKHAEDSYPHDTINPGQVGGKYTMPMTRESWNLEKTCHLLPPS